MSWRKKFLFSSIILVGFFVALEGLLAVIGFAAVTDTEDPFVGFSNQQPLMRLVKSESGEERICTSANKLDWFNDQSFPVGKSPKTKRVFCVGGSTTYGRPYWDATSFVGWLRELLPLVEPDTRWEVVNAGGVSYASYRVASVMQELAAYEPDLFIVYCGQNEFLERRTYQNFFDQSALKTNLHAAIAGTRTWALADRFFGGLGSQKSSTPKTILSGEVDEMLNHTIGPADYFRDDGWKTDVVRHYELNLQRMIAIARSAGAEILMVVPASNEKDCSPFKSLTHADDRRDADVQYQLGKDQFDRGDYDKAAASFRLAVNEDVCPLRALDSIVSAVSRVAHESDVPLVDFPALLRNKCRIEHGHTCLGEEYFLDHVHPDNATHGLLARWILDVLQRNSIVAGGSLNESQIDQVAARIDSRVDLRANAVALRNLAKVLHWAGKFSEALPRASDAIEIMPEDRHSIAVLADCLTQTGSYDEAVAQYERLFEVAPGHAAGYLPYGELLLWQGDASKARGYLIMAVAEAPLSARAPYFLGIAESELGNDDLALDALLRSLELAPDYSDTMAQIARVYANKGDVDAAIDWYKSALDGDSEDIDSRFRLGMLLMKQSNIQPAIEQFEAVLQRDPSHAAARTNLQIAGQLK